MKSNAVLRSEADLANAWSICLRDLKVAAVLAPNAFSLLETLSFDRVENGVLFVTASNAFSKQWIESHYVSMIQNVLAKNFTDISEFKIEVAPESKKMVVPEVQLSDVSPKHVSLFSPKKIAKAVLNSRSNLYESYKFQTFAEGPCNREALALCRRVAENPGEAVTKSLYIYGKSGYGKTHLLQAIAWHIIESGRKIRVHYCSSIRFLEDYVSCFKGSKQECYAAEMRFRETYEAVDVLLIDDVQLLASPKKDGTQKALFEIIERMRYHGKQVVFCSDKHPSEISHFTENLLKRLTESYTVALDVPDMETRLKIVTQKTAAFDFPQQERYKICQWIATPAILNFRELEGKLSRLQFEVECANRKITLSYVRRLFLPDFIGLTLESITDATALAFGTRRDLLCSDTRAGKIALARKLAIYLCREETEETLEDIGNFFNRSHSTVIAAYHSVVERLSVGDEQLDCQLRAIRATFGVEK